MRTIALVGLFFGLILVSEVVSKISGVTENADTLSLSVLTPPSNAPQFAFGLLLGLIAFSIWIYQRKKQ